MCAIIHFFAFFHLYFLLKNPITVNTKSTYRSWKEISFQLRYVLLYIIFYDAYGHKEGDKAISAFAGILKQVLRGEDIVGRIGGDEFVVFSSVKAKENVKFVEQRIRAKIDEYNRENHHPYQVLASIGSVVLEHSSNKCFDDAMLSADSVLYEEKMAKKKQGLSWG
ncbi:MAG: GGDEF domain-containing protein [Lachnospiraceae bacterium]|nr:GGDEF domain-containing protein [Lachnospiraceae bacterium]